MHTTLRELYEAKSAFIKIFPANLPIKIGTSFNRITERINRELEVVEQKKKTLVHQFGTLRNGVMTVEESDPTYPHYLEALDTFLSTPINIDIPPIDISILSDDIKLTEAELKAVKKFIVKKS